MLSQSVTLSMLTKVFSSILYGAMLVYFHTVSTLTIKRQCEYANYKMQAYT